MKKHLTFILAFLMLIINLSPMAFADEGRLKTIGEIREMQTRVYRTDNPQIVIESILKVLNTQEYKTLYKNEELLYINASKHTPVKDISKLLLAGYGVRICWDVFQTILTYGLKSYTLAGDVLLIRTEFKDKDLQQNIGINITNRGAKTEVRINICDLMIGKRDGLFFGKKNRIKTIQIRDAKAYNLFFLKLDEELKSKNIKSMNVYL